MPCFIFHRFFSDEKIQNLRFLTTHPHKNMIFPFDVVIGARKAHDVMATNSGSLRIIISLSFNKKKEFKQQQIIIFRRDVYTITVSCCTQSHWIEYKTNMFKRISNSNTLSFTRVNILPLIYS